MAESSFLSDILRRVSVAPWRDSSREADLASMCHELLSERSEASGLILAREILDRYEISDDAAKVTFFEALARSFGVDREALTTAVADWEHASEDGVVDAARRLHFAAEPQTQELIRVLNRVPGATAQLVRMRADLLAILPDRPDLRGLDTDFRHLFSSWFNRGFLEMQRIGWSTPASVLEKVIAYEAVHEIAGWDDLRQRVGDPDRKLFGFFHPAMPGEPLIFVEVALMVKIPGAIHDIINPEREMIAPEDAKVAVFYSISNCQKGLRGISFGNFLIKQVVADIAQELPGFDTFVTLSPVPGLRRYAESAEEGDPVLEGFELPQEGGPAPDAARKLAAKYLTQAKRKGGTAYDPVAHFHLSNGAEFHDAHGAADLSDTGQSNSWGVMVNYLYDPAKTETNHHAYANDGVVAMSSKMRSLARK
ncbi:malonyl-CoA decarboxylase [Alisedimentitalea sp. MJ-SS2]|uniref:malonyl-CoA decarboxylase n=1 Tax=Aliisedimentitalea sp. MJ-SS2 TaxID=3049795 RepID=UPI002909E817|nr:malonyl-CoA decarboxylase [Alisedimentitalea sp. MJ-SS2]MDU8927210.1 malonyl-CoA decarboxylase [Alisedimentitalea sp. MJ-SS2]